MRILTFDTCSVVRMIKTTSWWKMALCLPEKCEWGGDKQNGEFNLASSVVLLKGFGFVVYRRTLALAFVCVAMSCNFSFKSIKSIHRIRDFSIQKWPQTPSTPLFSSRNTPNLTRNQSNPQTIWAQHYRRFENSISNYVFSNYVFSITYTPSPQHGPTQAHRSFELTVRQAWFVDFQNEDQRTARGCFEKQKYRSEINRFEGFWLVYATHQRWEVGAHQWSCWTTSAFGEKSKGRRWEGECGDGCLLSKEMVNSTGKLGFLGRQGAFVQFTAFDSWRWCFIAGFT